MNRPSSHTDWTIGNTNFGTVNIEPTTGKKITGWTPGEAPPIQFLNWLFYNDDQWAKYFESVTDAHTAQIAAIQNSIFSTNLAQEVPSGTANGVNANFTLSQPPSSPTNTFVFIDSTLVPRSEYTLTGRNIVFNGGSIPASGSDVQSIYVIQTGFSGQAMSTAPAGSIPKVQNITVSAAQIAAKQVLLSYAPFDPTATSLDLITEGPQSYGADFTITGNVLSWNGLALDGVIITGDKLRILYFI